MTFTMSTTEEMRTALVDRAITALARGLDADERDIRDLVMGEFAPEEEVESDDCDPAEQGPVTRYGTWRTNGELIADVARLGYLKENWTILDPTYGRGKWWTKWQSVKIAAHDKDLDGTDFRHLDYPDSSFDAIAYDPPYVSVGGRSTSGIKEHLDAYGQDDAPKSPAELQELINDGLTEMQRLVKSCQRGEGNGIVLVKCQSYISSGKLWPGEHLTLTHALNLGFEFVGFFVHAKASLGPQPVRLRQVHERSNMTTLYVLRRR